MIRGRCLADGRTAAAALLTVAVLAFGLTACTSADAVAPVSPPPSEGVVPDAPEDGPHETPVTQEPAITGYGGEGELLQYAFTEPLGPYGVLYPPAATFGDIRAFNDSIFVSHDEFPSAYRDIELLGHDMLFVGNGSTAVLRVTFGFHGRVMQAHAFAPPERERPAGAAALIIPGSGVNQSTAIHRNVSTNIHHGFLDALEGRHTYVFVKPNEDVLAIHDGRKKLNESFIVAYHLNRGGSYSASYIVQSLAVTKHLQTRHPDMVVAGLSQGGTAALLNSMQSEPTYAIVLSGYSVIAEDAEWAGFDQVLLPGVWSRFLEPSTLGAHLGRLTTEYLFSWGTREQGTYRIEAEEGRTCERFEPFDIRIECVRFDGGHEVPVHQVRAFLTADGEAD
jgi:hypothetical protein